MYEKRTKLKTDSIFTNNLKNFQNSKIVGLTEILQKTKQYVNGLPSQKMLID
jgi:hypothetical protein